MSWVYQERDLEITINNANHVRKFDEPESPKPGQMKAVDFIVEYPDRYLFIEFKDPQHPDSNLTNYEALAAYYQSENIDRELVYKYRDSFLYEWAAGRAERGVYYLVLIAIEQLTSADLDRKKRDLDRKLPAGIPSGWTRPIVQDCAVFNIETWNNYLPDLSIRRMSSSAQGA